MAESVTPVTTNILVGSSQRVKIACGRGGVREEYIHGSLALRTDYGQEKKTKLFFMSLVQNL